MSRRRFSDAFKRDAVARITKPSYPVREVSRRFVVSPYERNRRADSRTGPFHTQGPHGSSQPTIRGDRNEHTPPPH